MVVFTQRINKCIYDFNTSLFSQELDTSIDGVRYFSIFDPEKRKSHHNTDNEQKRLVAYVYI